MVTDEQALARALRSVDLTMPRSTETTPFSSPLSVKTELPGGDAPDIPFAGAGMPVATDAPVRKVTFPQSGSTPTAKRLQYLRRRVMSVIALNVGLVIGGICFSVLAFATVNRLDGLFDRAPRAAGRDNPVDRSGDGGGHLRKL